MNSPFDFALTLLNQMLDRSSLIFFDNGQICNRKTGVKMFNLLELMEFALTVVGLCQAADPVKGRSFWE